MEFDRIAHGTTLVDLLVYSVSSHGPAVSPAERKTTSSEETDLTGQAFASD
jgi:hypothetical protein